MRSCYCGCQGDGHWHDTIHFDGTGYHLRGYGFVTSPWVTTREGYNVRSVFGLYVKVSSWTWSDLSVRN